MAKGKIKLNDIFYRAKDYYMMYKMTGNKRFAEQSKIQ